MNKVANKHSKNSKLPQSKTTHKMKKICTYGDLTPFIHVFIGQTKQGTPINMVFEKGKIKTAYPLYSGGK